MQQLSIEEVAAYLEHATITSSVDHGHAVIHDGINSAGAGFVLVNDIHGQSTLTETI